MVLLFPVSENAIIYHAGIFSLERKRKDSRRKCRITIMVILKTRME
jgi:hypothetical protein